MVSEAIESADTSASGLIFLLVERGVLLRCKCRVSVANTTNRLSNVFFFKQKTSYEISACLVGSEMCIRFRFRLPECSRSPEYPESAECKWQRWKVSVCYTHLTMPTSYSVWISVVAASLLKNH